MSENNWISVDDNDNLPPNSEVKIQDEFGNTGIGFPTYYPFTVEFMDGDDRKPYGWRGTPVPCENKWDGGWMIQHVGLANPLKGDVKYWKS